MEKVIVGTVAIAAGCALIILRKRFVNSVIGLNNKGLGFTHYGEKEKKIGSWFVPLFGLLTVVVGILILTGVFELK